MVEIKRISVDLAPKHLRQVSSYAINAGCEWILLTNGKEWRLYHVSFGQPPVTKLIQTWNLLTDDPAILASRFDLISYRSLKKGALAEVWRKTNILHPRNLLQAILSESSLAVLRRELRKEFGVLLSPEDVVSAIRRLFNEAALAELENVRISLPDRKPFRRRKRKVSQQEEPSSSTSQEVTTSGEVSSSGPSGHSEEEAVEQPPEPDK